VNSGQLFKKTVLVILALFAIACTRPEGESSSVKFSFALSGVSSKAGSQSLTGDKFNYVAINVANVGPEGFIFCSKDFERNRTTNSEMCLFTIQIDPNTGVQSLLVELPQVLNGPDRLFQALLVSSPAAGGNSMTFKYGSAKANLPRPEALDLTMSQIGGVQAGGHVKGRFLNGPNSGPSGLMQIKVRPDNGDPAMTVQEVEVYSGWFQAFSLETSGLLYVLDGVNIFGAGVAMNKASFQNLATSTSYASRVSATAAGSDYDVWGFFSNEASNLSGKLASASTCGGGQYVSCLSNSSKFVGPFSANTYGEAVSISGSAPSTLTWSYLPGMDSGYFDRVVVYAASAALADADLDKVVMSGGLDCDAFSKLANVQNLGEVSFPTTQLVTAALSSLPGPKQPIAVCPKLGTELKNLRTAAAMIPKIDNDGGCSNCKYLRLQISMYAESIGDMYRIGKLGCYSVATASYRGQGTPSTDHTSQIDMSVPSLAWGDFYSSGDCTGAPMNPAIFSISPGQNNSNTIYFKPTLASATPYEIAATISSSPADGAISYQKQYNKIEVLEPLTKVVIPNGQIMENVCYQGRVSVELTGGQQIPLATAIADNLTTNSGNYIAGDISGCANLTATSLTQSMGLNPIVSQFWFRATAASVTVTANPTSVPMGQATATTISGASPTALKVRFTPVGTLTVGKCAEFLLDLVNSTTPETVVPATANLTFGLSSSLNGYWSANGSCSGVTNSVNFSPGQSSTSIFYFPLNTGSVGISPVEPSPVLFSGNLTPSVSLPSDTSLPWIKVTSMPKLPKGQINIGSHNLPLVVGIDYSLDTTLKCYLGSSPPPFNSGSWTSCSSRMPTANTLTFDDPELGASPSETTHIMVTKGTKSTIISLNQTSLIGTGSLNIINCGATLTASAMSFDVVNLALQSNSSVCLAATEVSKTGSDNRIILPSGKSLFGKFNQSSGDSVTKIVTDVVPGSVAVEISGLSSTSYLSNVAMTISGTSGTIIGIKIHDASGGTLYSYGNVYDGSGSTAGTTLGMNILGSQTVSLQSSGDLFKVTAKAGGGVSKGIDLWTNGSSVNISEAKFVLSSATSSDGSLGVYVNGNSSGSSSNVSLNQVIFQGTGGGVRVMGHSSSGPYTQLNFQNVFIDGSSTAYSDAYPVFLQDNAGLAAYDSKLVNRVPGHAVVKYYLASSTGAYSGFNFMNLLRSTFQQHVDAPGLAMGSPSYPLGGNAVVHLEDSQFVKMPSSGSTQSAIVGNAGSNPIDIERNPSHPSHGMTLGCGTSGSDTWNGFYSGSSPQGSPTYNWVQPTIINTNTSGRCTHAN
jgi:hypothetical protein